jgi:hypothetical protein
VQGASFGEDEGAPSPRSDGSFVKLGFRKRSAVIPFASTGIHGLCELNVWRMQLDIVHQRITPASP